MFFLYVLILATSSILEGIKEIRICLNDDNNRSVYLDIIEDLDSAIRENTTAMNKHVDYMCGNLRERGVEIDEVVNDDRLGLGGF